MRYGPEDTIQYKIKFEGKVLSVQPRSNVWRYRLDNRTHTLTGYNIFLEGATDENLTADGKADLGRPRAVPDKQLGSVYDEGWLDEICTENRKDDDE